MSDGPECFMENWPGNSLFQHKSNDPTCACDLCLPHREARIRAVEYAEKAKLAADLLRLELEIASIKARLKD